VICHSHRRLVSKPCAASTRSSVQSRAALMSVACPPRALRPETDERVAICRYVARRAAVRLAPAEGTFPPGVRSAQRMLSSAAKRACRRMSPSPKTRTENREAGSRHERSRQRCRMRRKGRRCAQWKTKRAQCVCHARGHAKPALPWHSCSASHRRPTTPCVLPSRRASRAARSPASEKTQK